ncbi:MAG: hypothetical protein TH68_03150 [Candidatus Synechococcus spongiarum 142]|uniref:Uncharacterized protein n=1 Tax=Candidatus Synechococcus spongiarum 142 TaxID=1608213 RepID=A0A6N3X5M3_9SYNE|nr:MAG: hypothetical protein TH68_03150 [Candidatus Synechococcus spongiarum 142]
MNGGAGFLVQDVEFHRAAHGVYMITVTGQESNTDPSRAVFAVPVAAGNGKRGATEKVKQFCPSFAKLISSKVFCIGNLFHLHIHFYSLIVS